MKRIGVISDTHGLVRPEAIEFLKGSDMILHAGDIGKESIIPELEEIAPVIAVRGNIDKDEWAENFGMTESFKIEGKFVHMIHNISELDLVPTGAFDIVVFGHSHKPTKELRDGVLFFNPGSAGPPRFSLPIAIGEILIDNGEIDAKIKELKVSSM